MVDVPTVAIRPATRAVSRPKRFPAASDPGSQEAEIHQAAVIRRGPTKARPALGDGSPRTPARGHSTGGSASERSRTSRSNPQRLKGNLIRSQRFEVGNAMGEPPQLRRPPQPQGLDSLHQRHFAEETPRCRMPHAAFCRCRADVSRPLKNTLPEFSKFASLGARLFVAYKTTNCVAVSWTASLRSCNSSSESTDR
jgi:hypothetical protein